MDLARPWVTKCNGHMANILSRPDFKRLEKEVKPSAMSIGRRAFLMSSGVAAIGALMPRISSVASASDSSEPFQWSTNELTFSFDVKAGKLRQRGLVPASGLPPGLYDSSGVEVAVQCSGENSPDQGMKSGVGQPGERLLFAGRREESTRRGKRLVCVHTDPILKLRVESVYEAFDGLPVVRRYSRVINDGSSPVGIEFLSSAMLHGLADPQNFDRGWSCWSRGACAQGIGTYRADGRNGRHRSIDVSNITNPNCSVASSTRLPRKQVLRARKMSEDRGVTG
jgi:hypothetical protein